MLSPRSVQPCCALRAEELCEAAGRRCVTIQQDRMQFRQLNAYAAECNPLSVWIMNIHLSRSFYACPPLHSSAFCILRTSGSVVFGRTRFVFQLPADSTLPPPMINLHTPCSGNTQPLKSRQVIKLSALVTSLQELPVMTYNNNGNNSASAKVRYNSCQHSSMPPPLWTSWWASGA